MVHFPLHLHFCNGYSGDALGRSWSWRVVEERTVLGDWRSLCTSVCTLSRSLEGVCGNRHEFHCYLKVGWGWEFWWAVCVQVDVASDSPDHVVDCQPSWSCGWHFGCYQQWLSIMGSSIRKTVFCLLGDCPPVPIFERIDGSSKPNAHNCDCVVDSSCFHLLPSVGTNQPIRCKVKRPQLGGVWAHVLTTFFCSYVETQNSKNICGWRMHAYPLILYLLWSPWIKASCRLEAHDDSQCRPSRLSKGV